MKLFFLALFLAVLIGSAQAQVASPLALEPGAIQVQRAAINAERVIIDEGVRNESAACYEKFAVNNCLGKVNTRRREAMAALRRQEISLNDQERKIKGAKQIRRTEDKSSLESQQEAAVRRTRLNEDQQARLERENKKNQERVTSRSNETAARDANSEKLLRNRNKAIDRAAKQAAATDEVKKYAARQNDAEARRTRNEAEKIKAGKPAANPLPVPDQ